MFVSLPSSVARGETLNVGKHSAIANQGITFSIIQARLKSGSRIMSTTTMLLFAYTSIILSTSSKVRLWGNNKYAIILSYIYSFVNTYSAKKSSNFSFLQVFRKNHAENTDFPCRYHALRLIIKEETTTEVSTSMVAISQESIKAGCKSDRRCPR